MVRSLLAVLVVNGTLGVLTAIILIACAPWLIQHVFAVEPGLRHTGIVALRISALLLAMRFIETVSISAVRGCEYYRPTVIISLVVRMVTIAAALVLSWEGHGLVAIMWASLAAGTAGLLGQTLLAVKIVGLQRSWRYLRIRSGIREVSSFGTYTWLKATLGVLVGYADRLLVGALLGTGPLAYYTLCNQITQPIPALVAAAFSFLFPNVSAQTASGRWTGAASNYRAAAAIAALFVTTICLGIISSATLILRLWLGTAVAAQYHGLLAAMAIANGLFALSVVPHYLALALDRVRALVLVSLASGVVSVLAGYLLIHNMGLTGAAIAKIAAATVFLPLFGIVGRALKQGRKASDAIELPSTSTSELDFAK